MKKEQLRTSSTFAQALVNKQKGFSLVEVILATSIFVLLATALIGSYLYGQESTMLAGNRAQAVLLAEEGLEVMRNLRDADFLNLTNGTHGLTLSGDQWNLSGSSDVSGIFTRQIEISSIDDDRKGITSTVTWQQNPQREGTVSLATRLTNWMQVVSGVGNWANAIITSSLNLAGNNDGLKIALAGDYVYIIRDGSNPDLIVLNISNPATPVQVGSLDLTGTLVNIAVSGSYAYITSNDNSAELLIVDISNPASPSLSGKYDASGNTDGRGVFVSGTTVYMGRVNNGSTDEFLIVNASNPAIPTLVGSLNTGSDANEIVVIGNYAYIASGDNSQELQVISISNPSVPTLSGSLNISGNTDALTIDGFGSTIVIGQGSLLYVVNISTPSSPSVLGSINTGDIVNDINLGNSNNYVFVANSSNSAEFQVINIVTPSLPSLLGSLNLTGNDNLLGIIYDAANDRAYAVSARNSEEVYIFSPQ